MGERIQDKLCGFDTAIRYGGEEFVVLMPDVPSAAAASAGVRLCDAVAATPFKVSHLADGLAVTVSIGVATADSGSTSLKQLVKRADKAFYKAKNGGRNCVIVAEDSGTGTEIAPKQAVV